MKVRKGFVSNSSSSSFIVPFSKIPQNIEEMQKILFGSSKYFCNWPVDKVAETVFNDFVNQTPATKEKIIKEIRCGWFPGHPDYFKIIKADWNKERELWEEQNQEYEKLCDEGARELWNDFYEKHKKKYFYIFSYSDNDGSYYSNLEHEGLFENLDYIRISHH